MTRPDVVADAGPLLALACCAHPDLLSAVFAAVHVPQVVPNETTVDLHRPGASDIAAFVRAHAQLHPRRDDAFHAAVMGYPDEGESQALSLARELGCGVLIDERRGRQAARRHGIPLFGVVGVLLQAKRIGRLERVAPALEQMRANGCRIADPLVEEALQLAGEGI